jgi:hypothetical protein
MNCAKVIMTDHQNIKLKVDGGWECVCVDHAKVMRSVLFVVPLGYSLQDGEGDLLSIYY